MAIRIHELNHVALHVRDLDASVHFYGEVLGLPQLPRPAFDFPGAWFAFGKQELHLISDTALPALAWVHRDHYVALLALSGSGETATATLRDPNHAAEETISQEQLLQRCGGVLLLVHR